MKLHLCCGKRDFGSDWIHIDGAKYPHIQFHDITQLEFENNSVELIYCAHGLEYFDRKEVIQVLNEWHRVLKNNGTLRLAVPDFEAMCKLYCNDDYSLEAFLGPLFGKMPLNDTSIYHKTVYDFDSLKALLISTGFNETQRYDWRQTEHAKIDDHSQAYLPHMQKETGTLISLNIECKKI